MVKIECHSDLLFYLNIISKKVTWTQMSQKYVFLLGLFCIFLVLFLKSSESAQYVFRDPKKHFFDSFLTL